MLSGIPETRTLLIPRSWNAHHPPLGGVEPFKRHVTEGIMDNTGYGDIAPFEQLSSERFKALIDTNFYGVINLTRAALPIMRKQKIGYSIPGGAPGGGCS